MLKHIPAAITSQQLITSLALSTKLDCYIAIEARFPQIIAATFGAVDEIVVGPAKGAVAAVRRALGAERIEGGVAGLADGVAV